MNTENHHIRGLIFVITGATLWGIGGTAADYIFRNTPVTVDWFVTARLFFSGIILLVTYYLFFAQKHRTTWNKHTVLMFMIYALLGMTMVQYTFMAAIGYGNAAIATVLQFTGPVYIILWLIFRRVTRWTMMDGVIIAGMLAGVFMLATNGDFSSLRVSPLALFWGLLSGIALAYYTLHAPYLLVRLHPLQLVGGSMLVGGIAMHFIHPLWDINLSFNWTAELLIILTLSILLGTALAFLLYISSLKHLSSKEAGILGLLEPVSAILSSVIWLNINLGLYQIVGIIIILLIGIYISSGKKKE